MPVSKTKIFILAAGIAVLAGMGLSFLILSGKKSSNVSPQTSLIVPKSQEVTMEEETYTDESGFSFKYPKSLKLSDKTPDDNVYYSLLSLSDGKDEMLISIKDTDYKDIDQWLAKDKDASGTSLVGATSLGGLSAKQYSKDDKLFTVAIDQKVLYLLISPAKSDFWQNTQNLFASSFSIAKQQAQTSSSQDNIIYEEEEVVE